jgi:DNA-binding NarL/FixJ family response regulator
VNPYLSFVTVYLVEDSAVVRERLRAMLAELPGLQVVGEAEDATGAVAGIRSLKPHVVILDLQLAAGTGFDVLEQIRHDRLDPMVVVLTNHAYPAYRLRCLEAGADFFFDKSTQLDQLGDVLNSLRQAGPR